MTLRREKSGLMYLKRMPPKSRRPGALVRTRQQRDSRSRPTRLTSYQCKLKGVVQAIIASVIIAGCVFQPSRLAIRTAPDPNVCPGVAIPLPMRFRIDPSAEEQVVAISRDSRSFRVFWAPGFTADDAAAPVVRDPDGTVVARDGEILEGPLLHGYTVCATSDSIFVLLV